MKSGRSNWPSYRTCHGTIILSLIVGVFVKKKSDALGTASMLGTFSELDITLIMHW
jgi:hypothetical protein